LQAGCSRPVRARVTWFPGTDRPSGRGSGRGQIVRCVQLLDQLGCDVVEQIAEAMHSRVLTLLLTSSGLRWSEFSLELATQKCAFRVAAQENLGLG